MAKHLTLSDRCIIERLLRYDYSFAEISTRLNRSPSTISREIRERRCFATREHEKENDGEHRVLTEFYSLCGRNETGKKVENRVAASYGTIKKWFLKQFPEIEEYKKRNEEILKKVA